MVTHISKSPEETLELGRRVGEEAQAGEVIGLVGDLGAGKTQFAKGVALGLGITERIHSPTFALVNEYPGGRLPCYHLDLYRLESGNEILGAGLEEFMNQNRGVTVVEWYDRWAASGLPAPAHGMLVSLRSAGENERSITYEDFGA